MVVDLVGTMIPRGANHTSGKKTTTFWESGTAEVSSVVFIQGEKLQQRGERAKCSMGTRSRESYL